MLVLTSSGRKRWVEEKGAGNAFCPLFWPPFLALRSEANMKVGVWTRSARSFGGNVTYSLAGNYLASRLANYGQGITAVEITACFRGGSVGHSSLQRSHDDFHSIYLPTLPLVRFLRKKARICIDYETRVTDAEFLERYGFLSSQVFRQVLEEIRETLHLIDSRLKRNDDFDLGRFHEDVTAVVPKAPTSDAELRGLKDALDQENKALLAAMDPWERLEVDWAKFHPTARLLLNDPFFWSETDDYAPHGNDTGADLLAEFRKWNRRHPTEPAYQMAQKLLRSWGIADIDLGATDGGLVDSILLSDLIALSVTDDALIAVAFASAKLRGCCDPDTRGFAYAAIQRERMPSVLADRGWKKAEERLRTLEILKGALLTIPGAPP
jgi:uncharacterized protein YfeS